MCFGTRRIDASLSAKDQSGDRRNHWRGSAASMVAPHSRVSLSRAVYSHCGRLRADRADRSLGHARGVHPSAGLDSRWPTVGVHCRKRVRNRVSERKLSGEPVCDHLRYGLGSKVSRIGGHRERFNEERRARVNHPPIPPRKRRAGGNR